MGGRGGASDMTPEQEVQSLRGMVEALTGRLAVLEALQFAKSEDDAISSIGAAGDAMPAQGTDEQVAVQNQDEPGYIGATNSEGVIRSGDGSISKTRVPAAGADHAYVDIRVVDTELPWADEVPPEIRASGDGKIGNKVEDANNDQEIAWEKHAHGCPQRTTGYPGTGDVIIFIRNGVATYLSPPTKPSLLGGDANDNGRIYWVELDYVGHAAYRDGSDVDATDTVEGKFPPFRNP